MSDSPSIGVWLNPETADLVGRILDDTCLKITHVGGPRSGPVRALADPFNLTVTDDPRTLARVPELDLLLVAGNFPASLAESLPPDRPVLMTQPPVITGWTPPPRTLLMPSLMLDPAWDVRADRLDQLSPPETVQIDCGAGRDDAQAGALYAAWLALLELLPLPQTVHASCHQPAGSRTPDSLNHLTGHLVAHGQTEETGFILHVGPGGGVWHHRLLINGRSGHLIARHTGEGVYADDGDHRDTWPVPNPSMHERIADACRKLLSDRPLPTSDLTARRHAEVLACAQASLLSARTGEPEAPAKLLAIDAQP
ncbi:MAG: hypothetical protein R3336_09120 [Phycisphaeraceae bacterium]|nr:hypothetical protein [Phycisphaeraceae bacterium]